MSNKMICPFCGYELQENRTMNLCCPICGLVAPTKLWQALIQAKQDLEIARKALKRLKQNAFLTPYAERVVNKALEQIEHKE